MTFSEALNLIETLVLTGTLIVVGIYTWETFKLRRATQKQTEALISGTDPQFEVYGFGESVPRSTAHVALRVVGRPVSDLEAESLDGYEVRVHRRSLMAGRNMFILVFADADKNSIREASLILRFTNSIGLRRERRYRIRDEKLEAIAS